MNRSIEAAGRFFGLEERGASFRGEALGGLTTFMTMAYIIFANAAILSDKAGAGMSAGAVMVATCVAAALASVMMGLFANLPVALAPGMGLNAFVSVTLCGRMGYPWQVALGMVFVAGVIFLVLSVFRFRETIINAIPSSLKYGAAAGIGLFIAFIGLKNAGIAVGDKITFVRLGDLAAKPVLVAIFGLVLTGVLMALKLRAAVLLGLLGTGIAAVATGLLHWGESPPLEIGKTFLKLDILGALKVSAIPGILTLLFYDMFDTIGTLMGVAEEAGLVDDEGRIPNAGRALASDAAGTVVGSLFGTSTVTSYIESASGVAAGARTGLSSVFVGLLFLLSIPLLTVVGVLGSAVLWKGALLYPVTAPALIVVGFLMCGALKKIDWGDITEGLPAFLTMILMPLTFSISSGLAVGFVSYSILKLVRGEGKKVHALVHVIAAGIVLGYTALRIASYVGSKGAPAQ